MKEPVRKTKHPMLTAVVVATIAGLYFFLLADSDFPAPGPNLVYDIESYEEVDNVETRFKESAPIDPGLNDPRALAVGPEGRIHVAGEDEVAIFDAAGAELARFAVEGTPRCMAVGPDGTIFLGIGDHVEVFNSKGVVQGEWASLGPSTFITSIAANAEDVFVADAGHRVVYRYDHAGTLLGRIGESDPDRDVPGLVAPSPYLDVAFDDEGALWVVNPGLMGLESYRPNGDLITSWYRPSLKLDGFSGCCNPTHIAFRSSGRLVTCEKGLVRVKLYEVTAGEFEELVAGSKLFPKRQAVRDIAVDSQDRILVLDSLQHVIRIFEEREEENEQTREST